MPLSVIATGVLVIRMRDKSEEKVSPKSGKKDFRTAVKVYGAALILAFGGSAAAGINTGIEQVFRDGTTSLGQALVPGGNANDVNAGRATNDSTSRIGELEQEIEEVKRENQDIEEQNNDIEEENDDLEERIEDLTRQLEEARQEIARLQSNSEDTSASAA